MQVVMEEHVMETLKFMQDNIPTSKLIGVSVAVAEIAKLLWSRHPQEPLEAMIMCESQPTANESGLALPCAGDGSAVGVGVL